MRRTPKIISLVAGSLSLLISALGVLALVLLTANMVKYPGGREGLLAELWDDQGDVIVNVTGMLLVSIQLLRRRKNGSMALGFLLRSVSLLMGAVAGLRSIEAEEWAVLSFVVHITFYMVLAVDCLCPIGAPAFETAGYRWVKCGLLVGTMVLWYVDGFIRSGSITLASLVGFAEPLVMLPVVAAVALGMEERKSARPVAVHRPAVLQPPKERPPELPHYVLAEEGRAQGAGMMYPYRFSEYDAQLCCKCADALLSQSDTVMSILMTMSNGAVRNFVPEYAADRGLLVEHPDMLPRFRELQIEVEDNGLWLKVKFVPGTDRIEVTAPRELARKDITLRLDTAVHAVLRQGS